jgi:licheninase
MWRALVAALLTIAAVLALTTVATAWPRPTPPLHPLLAQATSPSTSSRSTTTRPSTTSATPTSATTVVPPITSASSAASTPVTPCSDAASCRGWSLVTSDDFAGTALDPAAWATYDGTSASSGEHWSSAQCTVADGVLTLTASSKGLCGVTGLTDSTYGRFELRAKFSAPADPNLDPVFLLWPELDSSWPAAGEIDAVEDYDPARQSLQSWNHYASASDANESDYAGTYRVDMTQWHTYAIDWERGSITLYVDNIPWHTYTSHVPSGPMHPVVQIDANGPITGTASVQVDWFHTYR